MHVKIVPIGEKECGSCGIRDQSLFADLISEDFRLIHQPIHDVSVASHTTLFDEGAPGQYLFTVRSGLVKLVRYQSDGTQRIIKAEVVEPKGVLWSKSVLFGIVAVFFAIANGRGWNLWFTEDQAREIISDLTAGAGVGAIISRILAWMPTRGPTGPGANRNPSR